MRLCDDPRKDRTTFVGIDDVVGNRHPVYKGVAVVVNFAVLADPTHEPPVLSHHLCSKRFPKSLSVHAVPRRAGFLSERIEHLGETEKRAVHEQVRPRVFPAEVHHLEPDVGSIRIAQRSRVPAMNTLDHSVAVGVTTYEIVRDAVQTLDLPAEPRVITADGPVIPRCDHENRAGENVEIEHPPERIDVSVVAYTMVEPVIERQSQQRTQVDAGYRFVPEQHRLAVEPERA